jgi:hypothetical protein
MISSTIRTPKTMAKRFGGHSADRPWIAPRPKEKREIAALVKRTKLFHFGIVPDKPFRQTRRSEGQPE